MVGQIRAKTVEHINHRAIAEARESQSTGNSRRTSAAAAATLLAATASASNQSTTLVVETCTDPASIAVVRADPRPPHSRQAKTREKLQDDGSEQYKTARAKKS